MRHSLLPPMRRLGDYRAVRAVLRHQEDKRNIVRTFLQCHKVRTNRAIQKFRRFLCYDKCCNVSHGKRGSTDKRGSTQRKFWSTWRFWRFWDSETIERFWRFWDMVTWYSEQRHESKRSMARLSHFVCSSKQLRFTSVVVTSITSVSGFSTWFNGGCPCKAQMAHRPRFQEASWKNDSVFCANVAQQCHAILLLRKLPHTFQCAPERGDKCKYTTTLDVFRSLCGTENRTQHDALASTERTSTVLSQLLLLSGGVLAIVSHHNTHIHRQMWIRIVTYPVHQQCTLGLSSKPQHCKRPSMLVC